MCLIISDPKSPDRRKVFPTRKEAVEFHRNPPVAEKDIKVYKLLIKCPDEKNKWVLVSPHRSQGRLEKLKTSLLLVARTAARFD